MCDGAVIFSDNKHAIETDLAEGQASATQAGQQPLFPFPKGIKRVWLNIGSWEDPPISANEDTITVSVHYRRSICLECRQLSVL
jgi:hypothetical protein